MDTVYVITHLNLRMESRLLGYAPTLAEAYKAMCTLGDQYRERLVETVEQFEGGYTSLTLEADTKDPNDCPELSVYHVTGLTGNGARVRHHTFIATPLKQLK